MPTPTIINGEEHFFNIIYEGNGGGQRVGRFVPFTDSGTITNSCIFNRSDNPKLSRTPSGDGNKKTWTLSFWAKISDIGTRRFPFSAETDTSNYFKFEINASNVIDIQDRVSASNNLRLITNRTFEDTSKFYHFLVSVDTTQSTSTDRVKFYVDGEQITSFSSETYPSQDYDTKVNSSSYPNNIGIFDSISSYGGYLAEVNLVDGTALTPSTFGLTDTSTGRWIPKTLSGITYGTNGFRIEFKTSGQLGDDTSGNTNDFTETNIASTDQTTDSPTQNHITFTPNRANDWSFKEGNLECEGTPTSGAGRHSFSNMILPKSGKYYFEMTVNVNNDSPRYFGLAKADGSVTAGSTGALLARVVVPRNGGTNDGHFISDGQNSSANGFSTTAGSVINFALDATNEKLYVGKNGNYYSFEGSLANPANGTGATFSNIYKTIDWVVANLSYSTGLSSIDHQVTWNFGGKAFAHTAPTGFEALQQDNFPETGKGIPGLVWAKSRDSTFGGQMLDSNRGAGNRLLTSGNNAEAFDANHLRKFLKGGYATGSINVLNTSADSMVAWNWVANAGTTSANTDGSGATLASTIQANPTAGFSIVTYAGSSSGAKTVAHGLSEIPEMIMIKNRTDSSRNWYVYDKFTSYASIVPYDGAAGYYSILNSNAARGFGNVFNNTAPTNKIFHIQDAGSLNTNGSGKNYIAYCWHSVPGYSKIGRYVGNGQSDGAFIWTGFKPAWVMIKCMSPSGNWIMYDNKRDPINPMYHRLYANLTNAQGTSGADIDFLSNGFKNRRNDSDHNTSSRNYVYMAFAEHPFLGDGVSPATAR